MADTYFIEKFSLTPYLPPPSSTTYKGAIVGIDSYFGGSKSISGTVKEKALPVNTPLRRPVHLFEHRTKIVVQSTWSDENGNYTFSLLRDDYKYFVVSTDYSGTYRAVIADNLTPI